MPTSRVAIGIVILYDLSEPVSPSKKEKKLVQNESNTARRRGLSCCIAAVRSKLSYSTLLQSQSALRRRGQRGETRADQEPRYAPDVLKRHMSALFPQAHLRLSRARPQCLPRGRDTDTLCRLRQYLLQLLYVDQRYLPQRSGKRSGNLLRKGMTAAQSRGASSA